MKNLNTTFKLNIFFINQLYNGEGKLWVYLRDRLLFNIFEQCQNDIEGLKNVQSN
jgi:hypothetical protein